MNQVKLIYFEGCPEAKNVRAALLTAGIYDFEVIIQNKLPKDHEFRNFSSPCLLSGHELVYGTRINGDMGSCTFGTGDLSQILLNIKTSVAPSAPKVRKGLRSFWGPFLTALLAFKCPACIPALAAGLSALGLGFMLSQVVIKSVFIFFLLITLTGLSFSYRKKHKNIIPVIGAIIFSLILFLGRFHFVNQLMLYSGMAGLLTMVIMDLALNAKRPCPACP